MVWRAFAGPLMVTRQGAIAAANADKAEQHIAALEQKISQLRENAHARPQDVRDLGPIVRDALTGLQH